MSIKEYFKGQEIFITGGSGFIGKALIEKLVRSCADFSKIYILLREKKGKSVNDRLNEILQTQLFDLARQTNPDGFKRIEAIGGDCAEIGLNICKEDLKRIENVTIIYHSAASVKFDDPLVDAVLLNTRGTRELLNIAETLKKLQVFLHVSTAFCNTERQQIGEQIYKPCADWQDTIKLAEHMDMETLEIFSLKYSEFKPNTYCFAKALAEQVVDDYKDRVPVVVYRPAIVTNCLDDPIPGWIDNFNGPIGMLIASGIGINRCHHSTGTTLHPIVPIDVVIRGMIVASYKTGVQSIKSGRGVRSNSIDVYNCTIDKIAPIKMKDLVELGRLEILRNPFERTLWVAGGGFYSCRFEYYFKLFMAQLSLALVVDTLLRLSGQKPMLMKLQRRLCAAMHALNVFIRNEWDFAVEKFFGLDKLIPHDEYDDFAFVEKSRNVDYVSYVHDGIKGGKIYLLKENPESSPRARTRLLILRVLDKVVIVVFYSFVIRFLYNFMCSRFPCLHIF